MKNIASYFIVLTLLALGCEKSTNLPTQTVLEFELLKTNSDNNFASRVDKILSTERRSQFHYMTDSVALIRETNYEVLLTNGDTVDVGFWFIAYEASELLILGEMDPEYLNGEDWEYKDFEDEASNFYRNFKEARVLIDQNVIFHYHPNEYFKIVDVNEIEHEGDKKSYLEIDFQGTAYGWYDQSGNFQEVFTFKNGKFRGYFD